MRIKEMQSRPFKSKTWKGGFIGIPTSRDMIGYIWGLCVCTKFQVDHLAGAEINPSKYGLLKTWRWEHRDYKGYSRIGTWQLTVSHCHICTLFVSFMQLPLLRNCILMYLPFMATLQINKRVSFTQKLALIRFLLLFCLQKRPVTFW